LKCCVLFECESPSVCIATGYKLNGGDSIPGKGMIFLSSTAVARLISYPTQLSRLIDTGIKRPERKAYPSSPSNAEARVISMQHVGESRDTERRIQFVFIQTYPFKILLRCQATVSFWLLPYRLALSTEPSSISPFPQGINVLQNRSVITLLLCSNKSSRIYRVKLIQHNMMQVFITGRIFLLSGSSRFSSGFCLFCVYVGVRVQYSTVRRNV
jgi:hypothetical protein